MPPYDFPTCPSSSNQRDFLYLLLIVFSSGPAVSISPAKIAAFKKGLRGNFGVAAGVTVKTYAQLDQVCPQFSIPPRAFWGVL